MMSPSDRKPNLIFDVTMKDLSKMESISRNVRELGYEKQNIHLVWVINDIEVTKEQNKTRDRIVPEEILMSTHEGASLTMRKLVSDSSIASKYLDGDIVFAFNKRGVDTAISKSKFGGSYVLTADYVRVKVKGKPAIPFSDLEKRVVDKIISYVPGTETWEK